MAKHVSHASSSQDDENFDLKRIFIGREHELDRFDLYLTRWQELMFDADLDMDTIVETRPSPNNKLQGLIILLYGHGGFGKSTLLHRFYDIACSPERHIQTGRSVDWEFGAEDKRELFNPSPDQKIDAYAYYQLLCEQLAFALEKKPKDFRSYQSAVTAVGRARAGANEVLERMQGDDHYAALRGVTIDALVTLIGTVAPSPVGKVLGNEKTKALADEGMKIGGELALQAYTKLRDALGNTFSDYLDAPLRLGLALGRDLHELAKNFPLLLFFDTYEEIDPADTLLRVVMGAAGLRVGWVLAGRDNLWGGLEQRKRSVAKEYGYKDIVAARCGLEIDFNVGGVGAFTLTDVQSYFDQVYVHTHANASLPKITEEEAEQILQTTQGVPLAVSIAAALYQDTADVKLITEKVDGQREIIDVMVERYLLHARNDLTERNKLYGLALLRRPDNPATIAVALGLHKEDADKSYEQELSRLHRRYSFIFTEKEQPSLHQEVRYFLRLWLLERRKEPAVVAINERLVAAQKDMLKKLEECRLYTSLQERLQDDEWVELYLSLTEQQCWLDIVEGMHYLIPFMLAAAIYRRNSNEETFKLGSFFSAYFRQSPYMSWWTYASQCLVFSTNRNASEEAREALKSMAHLAAQSCPSAPPFLPDCSLELEATLWVRLGEAHRGGDDAKALLWYEKALTRLDTNVQLRTAAAQTARNIAYKFYEEKNHAERIPFLNRAIELMPDYTGAYNSRGIAYRYLKEYQQAIEDFDQAIALDPTLAMAYNNRGIAYQDLKEYQRAIEDCDQAIALDPTLAMAYNNRGSAYGELKEYQRAIEDFDQAIALDPTLALAYNNRGNTYRNLKEYQRAIESYDQVIALDPTLALAYNNRGSAYGELKEYQLAIESYDQAIALDPTYAMAYRNRGNTYRDLKEYQRAIEDFDQAIALDPTLALAYRNRGNTYRDLKEYQLAIESYDQAIALDPTLAIAYFNRGNTYGELKEYQLAIENYDQAIALDSTFAPAYFNRGNTYQDLKEYQRATEDYDQAIALDPTYAMAYFNRGNVYQDLKEYQLAIEDFDQAIALDPTFAMAYYNRGIAYQDLKEYQLAIEDFDQAIALDPTFAIAYFNRGNTYRDLKRYPDLLGDFKQAFILEETLIDTFSLNNMLGLAFTYVGQYADAIDRYETDLKKDPNNHISLYNKAVAVARWKGLSVAQPDIEKAREALLSLKDAQDNFSTLYGNGGIEALLGNTEEALDYLHRAIVLDREVVDWARHDVAWLNLHSHPRFLALIS